MILTLLVIFGVALFCGVGVLFFGFTILKSLFDGFCSILSAVVSLALPPTKGTIDKEKPDDKST